MPIQQLLGHTAYISLTNMVLVRSAVPCFKKLKLYCFGFLKFSFYFALLKLKKTLTQQVNDVKMNGSTTQLGVPQHVKRREKNADNNYTSHSFLFCFLNTVSSHFPNSSF